MTARQLLTGLVGRTLRTLTEQAPNTVLRLERDNVIVGTDESPEGEPVSIAKDPDRPARALVAYARFLLARRITPGRSRGSPPRPSSARRGRPSAGTR